MAFAGTGNQPKQLSAAMAKARSSEAAQIIAATAHGLHGAIGITEEYDLQLLTRRLHEWRTAHGSEAGWAMTVGDAFLQSGASVVAFAREVGRVEATV
ncbi:hypothetical protein AWV80_03025 [Cupriavidus sp. UYMU48A]|nr:hypothetical protein AWV80_03025 [Cupriavidus sp. UYMU48A]